ncbi:MAG: sulfatase-like hydrolase/transferase [Acidobacteria bacterium]|nr:sulfatase-like hydrolase/transferase [Acidobacteriota bacterium]
MALSRRDFLKASSLAAFAACASTPEPAAEAPSAEKPNVVLILCDDMGYEAVGCYGGTSHQTPNLDLLAATGVRFTQAYAQPLCTPTRLQLMTGQYNYRNWLGFGLMRPDEKTFGHQMQAAGYKTCISGKWQMWSYNPPDFEPEFRGLGQRPEDAGFDDWYVWHAYHTEDKGSRYADPTVVDNAKPVEDAKGLYGPDLYVEHIERFMEAHRAEPFFVYYPMALTHGPFNPTPDSADWAGGDRLASSPKNFHDMVEYMDKCVGRVTAKLDELGLREKTLILFFSDNGSPRETTSDLNGKPIQGGKGLPTDAGTRVPLIANWTGVTPEGKVLDDLIDATDIYATVIDAGGAKPPAGETIDGVSFLPRLRGEPGHPKDVIIVWHDPRPGAGKKAYTHLDLFARDKRYKLYDDGRLYDVPNDVLEEHPIPAGEGSAEAEAARLKLRAALDEIPAEKREPLWDPYAEFRQPK